MIVSSSQAKKITDKVLSLSRAEYCEATLGGHNRRHLRFALNTITTNGEQDDLVLSIRSTFGTRSGSASTNELSDRAIAEAVKKSEQIAKFAPPDPEFMPPVGTQNYLPSRTWFDSTAKATAERMAEMAKP